MQVFPALIYELTSKQIQHSSCPESGLHLCFPSRRLSRQTLHTSQWNDLSLWILGEKNNHIFHILQTLKERKWYNKNRWRCKLTFNGVPLKNWHLEQKVDEIYLQINHRHNRPFRSSPVPLFQSESKCETILTKMTLICMKMKLHAEPFSYERLRT